jgi:hypothetical protein
MASLQSVYATALGVIPKEKPILNEKFFPLTAEKFILIHNDFKLQSKGYELFPEAISLLKPVLHNMGYRIYQIGGKNDPIIDGTDGQFLGLSWGQTFYLMKRAGLFMGIDSVCSHIAAAYEIPSVVLFSHTYSSQVTTDWLPADKKIILEPDWGSRKPSYKPVESPKMIRTIKVENVVQAVFDLLCKGVQLNMKTIRVGEDYYNPVVEIVPDHFQDNAAIKNGHLHFRMDLHHNEECLFHWLKNGYKAHIITKKPIPVEKLKSFRPNIGRLILMAESLDSYTLEYLKAAKNLGLDLVIFCENKEILPHMREKFFDYVVEELDWAEQKELDNIPKDAKFFTKKQIHSNGQIYPSVTHYKQNIPFSRANKILDDKEFWLDMEHFYFYT